MTKYMNFSGSFINERANNTNCSGFTRTVFAQQSVDLAGSDIEGDAVERDQVAEALADAVDRQQRLANLRHQPSSVLIFPSRIAFSVSSSFCLTSGEALHTTMPEACGPIARPNAL